MVREAFYPERPLLSRSFRQPHDDQRVLVWDLWLVRILIKFPMLTRYGSHDIYSRLFKICKTSIPSTYRVSLSSTTFAGYLANRSYKRVLDIGTASGIV
jgi:hypothetical protein